MGLLAVLLLPVTTRAQWATNGNNINNTNTGNVGIGTISPTAKLDVAGDVNASGTITGGNIVAKYQDLAEWVPSTQKLAAGTVVVLDKSASNHDLVSSKAYDTKVAGVISAQPGISLGEAGEGKLPSQRRAACASRLTRLAAR